MIVVAGSNEVVDTTGNEVVDAASEGRAAASAIATITAATMRDANNRRAKRIVEARLSH